MSRTQFQANRKLTDTGNRSPFQVGGAVEPPYFVGREKELKKLSMDLKGLAENYLILAPRRYGKSSLLRNLKRQNENRKGLLVPYVCKPA